MATQTLDLPIPAALEKRAINPWLIAITVTLATFMELLDTASPTSRFPTSPEASPPATTKAPGCSPAIWSPTPSCCR